MQEDPIVIIGTGLAGYMLAKEFRKLNTEKPLIIITNQAGRFYSKPQLSTALANKKTAEQLTVADAMTMAEQLPATIYTFTEVNQILPEEKTIVAGDKKIVYEKLVLACGTEVIKAPLEGNAADKVISVNDLSAYEFFREQLLDKKKLLIMGAGLVGCEFANDLIGAGYQVDVVAPDIYPLTRLVPPAIGEVLYQALAEAGVNWHLGQLVQAVNKVASGYVVKTSTGEEKLADLVFSAIGLRPRRQLAADSGVAVDTGICVDEYLQTDKADIYALGDCAEVQGQVKFYVAPLLQCARALAKTLAGEKTAVQYPPMPVVIKTSACPITVLPPPAEQTGEWQISGVGKNKQALFVDKQGALHGFVLTGEKVKLRAALIKQLLT